MAYNSWRISLDPRLYAAAKNGDMVLLKEVLFLRPIQIDGEIAVPVAGEALVPHQRLRLQHKCLLGVTHGGDTALHIAARFGHLEVATVICNINLSLLVNVNDKLETPLHYAARAGKCDLVDYFIDLANHIIELGDMLRKRNRDGETALYQAILYKHPDVVEKFRNGNENQVFSQLVSIPNNDNISPLYLAIMHGQKDIVTSLIGSLREAEDVPPEAYAGPDGQTALHSAALRRGFVRRVLDWKPELAKSTEESGSTALHCAISSGNLEAVSAILQTDITCAYMADSSGLYPVHIAVKMGFVLVVAKLFDRCPDLDQLVDNNGRNLVHLAVEEQRDGIVRWICTKTELTEAMNAQDNNGDTALHLAVKAGHLNTFPRLLGTKKAHLFVTNKDGLTPHDLAISNRTPHDLASSSLSNCLLLFDYQPNPDLTMIRILQVITCCRGIKRRDHFESEYRLQLAQKKEKMVEGFDSMAKTNAIGAVLIASAAFAGTFSVSAAYKTELTEAMNVQDNNGDTALHLAVKAGHLNIFARLLGTKMAHLCVTNKDGLTPHDLAISNRTAGFTHWQNPDQMMIRILQVITCCRGIKRRDHFESEYRLQLAQKKEKIVEGLDSMAKTNAIGAVLIASAAFAGTFSVSAAYKSGILAGHESTSLNFAFKSFILMVVFAFGCSIVATSIIMQSALTFLAPIYRQKYIIMSQGMIHMATMGFVGSFAIGVYIVVSPVSKWLAYLVCFSLSVVPVLVHPHLWPNCLLIRALIKYLGWKGFLFGCYSLQFFTRNILFGIFVILVLLGSLEPHIRVRVLFYGTTLLFIAFLFYFKYVRYIIKTI